MNAIKYGVGGPLLAGLAALFLSSGHATAQPSGPTNGCDPYSGALTSCLGGGPWQNQDGSSPDTYGPTGQRGFLRDALMVFPNGSQQKMLELGRRICVFRAEGYSDNIVEAGLVEAGLHEGDAGYLVTISGMYLC